MLQTQNLSFAYNKQNTFQFPDLDCQQGEALLIIGESGKGKTTLLHLLAGLQPAQKGNILISNTNITQLSKKQLDQFRGQNIGIIFQKSHFIAALSVKDNLLLAQYLAKTPQKIAQVKDLLQRLNLADKLNKNTQALSQGEQQRVAIARALLNQPKLILADEPTSSLDDKNTQKVIHLLLEQAKLINAALVIVTHDQRVKDQVSNFVEL